MVEMTIRIFRTEASAVVRRLSQFPSVFLTGCELFTQQMIEAVPPGKDREGQA
jgi:hypothetical protein